MDWNRVALAAAIVAAASCLLPAQAQPQFEPASPISDVCQYSPQIAAYAHETTMILCDTVKISRTASDVTLEFGRRSWGATARFFGVMSGDKMSLSRIALRGDEPRAATGTCELFRRENGDLFAVRCLGKFGSRSVAANFVPSFL